jgi:hypothetical protein
LVSPVRHQAYGQFFAMQHIMDRVFYELFAVARENYGTWIVGWKNHQQDVLNLF